MEHSQERKSYIYGLFDESGIRYIGIAVNPRHRLKHHLNPNNRTSRSHRHNWLNAMSAAGKTPTMLILEECAESQRESRERAWIAVGRSLGWNLTNTTDGGDGTVGNTWTEERRRYMSELFKNRSFSEQTREKISKAASGRKLSESHRRKLSEAKKGKSASWNLGLKRSEESKQKMREAWKRRKERDHA
jgi:group I intron endonuclease